MAGTAPMTECERSDIQECKPGSQEQIVMRFIKHHGFLFLKDLEPANFWRPSDAGGAVRLPQTSPSGPIPGSQPLAEALAGSGMQTE